MGDAEAPPEASAAKPEPKIFRVAKGKAQAVPEGGADGKGGEFFKGGDGKGKGVAPSGRATDDMTAAELDALEHGTCMDKVTKLCCKSNSATAYHAVGDKAASTDPFAKLPMCKRIFPLLYADHAGWRQLAFFISFFVPLLTAIIIFLVHQLPTDRVMQFRMPNAPVLLESDHCNIVFESADPKMAKPLNTGELMLSLKLGAPRRLTGSKDTFVKMCGKGNEGVTAEYPCPGADANPVVGGGVCKGSMDDFCSADSLALEPKGEAIGTSLGCSQDAHLGGSGVNHMCVMNSADKTFIDMAYGNWDCTISVAVPPDEPFPDITLKSTEAQFYPELTRVLVSDAEVDTLVRRGKTSDTPIIADGITQQLREGMAGGQLDTSHFYRDNRHSICLRRLNFTNLDIQLPDSRVELDCFTTSGSLNLKDTGNTHFHVFSDADQDGAPMASMDVALNEGDLYLWSHRPVAMQYDAEAAAPTLSQLCLAGREVLGPTACGANNHTLLPARRAAGTSDQAACTPAGALALTINNNVEAAYHAALPKPLVAPCNWTALDQNALHNFKDSNSVDMPGFGPFPDAMNDESACQELCEERADCVGYTWRNNGTAHPNFHKCWLVSKDGGAGLDQASRPQRPNFVSGVCVRGNKPTPANGTEPNIFNHVQVEVGGFHDSIYEVGKSFNRDGSASTSTQPITVVLDGKADTSNVPTFSKVDEARLASLFHHDAAAMPDEKMVELQVIGEGIPAGRFVWYANPVYAYLSPELLSFLSLNILTPTSITVSLELVDNFCPIVHMAKRETTMEVIEQVYRSLYKALAPLPTFSVFGFTQFDEPYPGLTYGVTPLRTTVNDFMFFRDETSPKQFVTLTRNAARKANTIFQAMLTFNVLLTFLSAVLFVYFAVTVISHKKKLMLFELVESYRHDLGAVQYVTLEKEHKKQEMQEKAESSKIEYKIITRTGDHHREAGMYGRVFVTLVGKTDETREIALDDDQGRAVFGKGCQATFSVKAADVGRIEKVRVRSQPLSAAFGNPDWLLDSISVMAPRFGPSDKPPYLDVRETVHFPCNRWFSEVERDQNAKVGTKHDSPNIKEANEGLQQVLLPGDLAEGRARSKPGGSRRSMFSTSELKERLEVPSDDEDSSDDEMEQDMQLDDSRRTLLHRQLTDAMLPRASPFWLVDVMLCVDKRRSDVAKMGGELDPRQEDETCRLFKHKLLNKYLSKWEEKVEEGRREITKKYPGLNSTLKLDEDGHRIVDPETGRATGQTVIRQGIAKGYRAKKTLVSDLSPEERMKLKKKNHLEMEQNFHLFDTSGLEQLGAAEVRVAMKARGIFMSMREAKEVIADLDSTGDRKMNLAEYKALVELKNRELPENYEAMFAFKLFADPVLDCINFKQLKRVCNELGQDLDDTSIVEMIDRVDLEGEGVVTQNEFLEVMGTPTNADAIVQKIKSLEIPMPAEGSEWPSVNNNNKTSRKSGTGKSLSGGVDRVMFERLVSRYWRRYRLMNEGEQGRFLACCAYAAVPGNYMDTLPGTGTLALMGLSKKDARGILKHARTQMRLESFQAWFELTAKDQAQMVRAILEFPAEYFAMGITKRRWFYKQAVPDRLHYLRSAQRQVQTDLAKEFRDKLVLEAKSAFVHLLILFAPTIPLMMAGSLFDTTYKKFNPDANQSSYGSTFILCLAINSIYLGAGFAYLIWYYVVKNIKSRMGREGPVEKKLRLVDYVCLFVVLFMAVLVLVCVLYWIVLGTVLNPEKVVPIMVSVTVFFAAVAQNWGLLQKFRRVILTKIGEMANKAQKLRMKAATFKTKVTAKKTALLVQAHSTKGKEAHELERKAHKLVAVEDKLREVMAQCARTDNVLVEFLVKQGFSSADIIVAVIGSALTLLLLLIFIAVGVAAFTSPGGVSASINSGLSLVAGKVSSGASESANSPDRLERLIDLVEAAAEVVLAPASEALGFAQEDAADLLPGDDDE